jgi:phosphate transport system substrate-binding protein
MILRPPLRALSAAALRTTALAASLAAFLAASPLALAQAQAQAAVPVDGVGVWYVLELLDLVADRAGAAKPVMQRSGVAPAVTAFCAGPGADHPAALALPRALTAAEEASCRANGVDGIVTVPLVLDALVLVQAKGGPLPSLTAGQLYRALSARVVVDGQLVDNPFRSWAQVDPTLPDLPIAVSAPGEQSPDRALITDQLLRPACLADAGVAALPAAEREAACGPWRSDVLVPRRAAADAQIRMLERRPGLLGVEFLSGYSLNTDRLAAVDVDGATPEAADLRSGRWPLVRPHILSLKADAAELKPALAPLLAELAPGRALGPDGWLTAAGLIPPR